MSYPYNRKCPCVVGYVYVSYNADNKEDIEVKFDLKEPPYFCVGNIVLVIWSVATSVLVGCMHKSPSGSVVQPHSVRSLVAQFAEVFAVTMIESLY
jgi:hypothetical protein